MNTARFSINQNIGRHHEEKVNQRKEALRTLELAKQQNKPVKYDLRR